MKRHLKRAAPYFAAFLALLLVEILIGRFASGWIRSYAGDVLVLPLLFCLIRIFTNCLPRTLPLWLFALGCFTELLQLLRFSEILGFAEGSLPAVILGTRADWADILCYALGTLLVILVLRLKGDSHD
jgi:hypothetical protein